MCFFPHMQKKKNSECENAWNKPNRFTLHTLAIYFKMLNMSRPVFCSISFSLHICLCVSRCLCVCNIFRFSHFDGFLDSRWKWTVCSVCNVSIQPLKKKKWHNRALGLRIQIYIELSYCGSVFKLVPDKCTNIYNVNIEYIV